MTVTMHTQAPVSEILKLARAHQHTRLPIWETREDQRRIIKLMTLNTVLYQPNLDPAQPITDHVKPTLFLNGDLRLKVALRRLQRNNQRLTIMLNHDRNKVNIINLKNILKTIFGEVKL